MWATEFPTVFRPPVQAYLALTGCHGKSLIVQIRLVSLVDNTVLIESNPSEVSLPVGFDPITTLEIKVDVPPIPMPSPGVFAFEVLVNGHLAGVLRLNFKKLGEDENE